MKFFEKFRKNPKVNQFEKVTNQYRCPECGKYTEITTYIECKQLYNCSHCGRTMVIFHGRTIGYK